jgi:hypothetical protein
MNTRSLILPPKRLTRAQIVERIIKQTCPDPDELSQWALALFEDDPADKGLQNRIFLAVGGLRICASSVANCLLSRKRKHASRMRVISAKGEFLDDVCL